MPNTKEYNTRWFTKETPLSILCFLPMGSRYQPIDVTSRTFKKFLEIHDILPDFEIVIINSKEDENPLEIIEKGMSSVKEHEKKGLLILSGRQCSLGVSIRMCDIVLLLNNNNSFDLIYQMMFRCMTEDENKKCGFVIDMNIYRTIKITLYEYGILLQPNKEPEKSIKYLLQNRIINLNPDKWYNCFGHNEKNSFNKMYTNICNIYSQNIRENLEKYINRLSFKNLLLSSNIKPLQNLVASFHSQSIWHLLV